MSACCCTARAKSSSAACSAASGLAWGVRKTKTCPKCDCKKLLDIKVVADANDSASTQAYLAVRFEGHSFLGNTKNKLVGRLQAVTCSECGYTELYVADAPSIEPDGQNITWL